MYVVLTLGGRFGLGECCCAGGTAETSSYAVGLAQVGIHVSVDPTHYSSSFDREIASCRHVWIVVYTKYIYFYVVYVLPNMRMLFFSFLSWCAFALSVAVLHSQFLRVRGPAWVWRCGDPPHGGRERPPSAHASCSRRGRGEHRRPFFVFPPTAVHETVKFKMCSRILHVG